MHKDPTDEFRRRLQLPPLLGELLRSGKWCHPGDSVLLDVVPFIRDPLDFLPSRAAMLGESGPLMEARSKIWRMAIQGARIDDRALASNQVTRAHR